MDSGPLTVGPLPGMSQRSLEKKLILLKYSGAIVGLDGLDGMRYRAL